MNSDQPIPEKKTKAEQADGERTELVPGASLDETTAYDPHGTQINTASATWIGMIPENFGRYKVLKTLGKGGMGAVYLAEDLQLDRKVAIKVPFQDSHDNQEVLDRFRREAKSLAAIVHPNICPIHEVGEVNGVHFISMTYVEGKPLSHYIRPDKPVPIKRAITLVRKLASALHHAHSAGIIHRDLKPANIIINKLKEPVIMDFGLARREGKSDAAATVDGAIMGTPAYMSPEQVAGDTEAMGPGCDIYSLGVILYELLTGERPFSGGLITIMSKIANEDPSPPSELRAEIDAGLDAICLRALAKQQEDRFASMEEFSNILTDCLKARLKRQASAPTDHPTSRGGTLQAGASTPGHVSPDSLASESNVPATPSPLSTLAHDLASSVPVDGQTETGAAIRPVGQGYRLIKQLGSGQYGEVWLGMAPGDIEVAIKKLLFPVGHKATQVELQALELMKRLRHSFLIQVQAYWVMEDQLMIVMELADGSLEERLAECQRETGQGIPRQELFGYMREAAEAIDFLHQEKVLHRDIKPGNILLVQGHVKVADFGIATSGVMGADQLTATSATLGTPLYMGPELWNRQAGPRSDQYSLAVTYVELRLGTELHFNEQNRLDLSMLAEAEQAVIGKALAPDPRDRYESCQQFSQALDDILESEIREVEERRRRKIQAAADRRRTRRLQLVVGAFILASLPVAWYAWQMLRPGLTAADLELVAGGAPENLTVFTVGRWSDEPLDLAVLELPPGIEIVESGPVEGGAEVRLQADLQHLTETHVITLVATAGDTKVSRTVMVKVQEAPCVTDSWDRENWGVAKGALKKEVAGKVYYDRIVRILPGREVELVLIPESDANNCPTFYCMRNKVSNGLFAEFANALPGKINPQSQWREGVPGLAAEDNPDLPVFGVGVLDAHEFALWFGGKRDGKLPTAEQWDKAAGRDDASDVEGPFLGSPDGTFSAGDIGINLQKPLKVGTAPKDVSHFGCRDMAGNGREWTRSLFDGEPFPVDNPDEFMMVYTKGRRYSAETPLRYRDLERHETSGYMKVEFTDEEPLSFRCVVEP